MKKFTDEQIQFVIDYPDYPAWLIADAFEEKYGVKVSKSHIVRLRIDARGTSNVWSSSWRSPNPHARGKSEQEYWVDQVLGDVGWTEKTQSEYE